MDEEREGESEKTLPEAMETVIKREPDVGSLENCIVCEEALAAKLTAFRPKNVVEATSCAGMATGTARLVGKSAHIAWLTFCHACRCISTHAAVDTAKLH